MYLSRGQPSSQSSQSLKFSIPDACDRIKDEISCLQQQVHNLKMEYEKVVQEKSEMQRHYVMYYEITYGLNVEMHRQSELAKRLGAILAQVIPFLTQEHQTQVAAAIERAKQVPISELNNIISQNFDDSKFPKLSNGSFGMPPDQMDIYKLMSNAAGLNPASMSSSANSVGNLRSSVSNNLLSSPLVSMHSGTTVTSTSNSGASCIPIPSSSVANSSSSCLNNPPSTSSGSFGISGTSNFLPNNPSAVAQAMAAFASSVGGQNSPSNPMLNPSLALSAIMNDKSIDDKQRQAAATAMAAALAAATAQSQPSVTPNHHSTLSNMGVGSQFSNAMSGMGHNAINNSNTNSNTNTGNSNLTNSNNSNANNILGSHGGGSSSSGPHVNTNNSNNMPPHNHQMPPLHPMMSGMNPQQAQFMAAMAAAAASAGAGSGNIDPTNLTSLISAFANNGGSNSNFSLGRSPTGLPDEKRRKLTDKIKS